MRVLVLSQREERLVAILRADAKQRPLEGTRDRGRRIDVEQTPAMHQRHAIAARGLVHVGRRDDRGEAARLQPSEQIPELAA